MTDVGHKCCACFTHNNLPCCNKGHAELTADELSLADRGHDGSAFSRGVVEQIISGRLSVPPAAGQAT